MKDQDFEIGDIIIFTQFPGHVAMVYEPKHGVVYPQMVHAQRGPNFHTQPFTIEGPGNGYVARLPNCTVFRPPWGNREDKARCQQELKTVADRIGQFSTYGVYRALRLEVGSSSFGAKASARLKKYRNRRENMFPDGKFVTTVTCAEAVILCYQMTFEEGDEFFIRKDAAHTMPSTLAIALETMEFMVTNVVTEAKIGQVLPQ